MKKTKKFAWPKKISDLLELAVDDAIAVSKWKGFSLYMGTWQSKDGADCTACMAGAVLVRHKITSKTANFEGYDALKDAVCAEDLDKTLAINEMRHGYAPEDMSNIETAAIVLALKPVMDNYDQELDGGRAPWASYRKAIENLRAAGF